MTMTPEVSVEVYGDGVAIDYGSYLYPHILEGVPNDSTGGDRVDASIVDTYGELLDRKDVIEAAMDAGRTPSEFLPLADIELARIDEELDRLAGSGESGSLSDAAFDQEYRVNA